MRAITKRQFAVLEFIRVFITNNRYSPPLKEIAQGVGLRSLASVYKHMRILEEKGFIQRDFHCARSVEVLRVLKLARVVRCQKCGAEVCA